MKTFQDFMEGSEDRLKKEAEMARLRSDALSTPAAKKAWDKSPSNPNSPNWNPKSVKNATHSPKSYQ